MDNSNSLSFLYVEDDAVLREQYSDFLSRRCKVLYTAKDGIEALEVFEKNHIDLLITDVRMPNMNGIELIKNVRQKDKDVQIIITSAFNDSEYLLKAINEGVTRYILKPIDSNNLKLVLNETIKYIETLKENESQKNKLDIILDNVVNSLFLIDFNLNIIKSNKAAKENFKFLDNKEQSILDILNTKDEDLNHIFKTELFEEKKIEDIELKITNLFNKELFVKVNCFLLETERLILVSVRNITTLIKYESLIKKYVKTIDKHILSMRLDTNLEIIYASNAFCELMEQEQSELVGSNLKQFIKDKDKFTDLPLRLKDEEEIQIPFEITTLNGEKKYLNGIFSKLSMYESNVGYTLICHDISNKKKLDELVITDKLTNFYNKKYFDIIKTDYIKGLKRDNCYVSFALVDIDDFKLYNDTYGEHKGDEVIKNVAIVIKNNLQRVYDYAFRTIDEEFILLFKTVEKENSKFLCDKIVKEVSGLDIEHKYSTEGKITVSIGLVTLHTSEAESIDGLYYNADKLLYTAKTNGKNKCVWEA